MTPADFHQQALGRVRRVLVGVDETFELLLAAALVGGHVLLEGVPGTAKTLTARCLAQLLRGTDTVETGRRRFQRIQFTPDLMPSDILGTNVYNAGTGQFSLRLGPVFAQVVVADEINRAPAKTQSALLEAMEEKQVTIEGQRVPLPPLFMVVATQNPVEFEGTYPLPEAQVDRFLFKLLVEHGSADAEREVLLRHHSGVLGGAAESVGIEPLVDETAVLDLRHQVAAVQVEPTVADYMVALQRGTRSLPEVIYGASVRGGVGLLNASKAVAAFAGRDYVTPDDVKRVAPAVLRHRLLLKAEAELDGVRPDDVVQRLLANVPVPR